MLKEICGNPYRLLGVYSNANKKEIVSNKGKINAFLQVGRSISFPLDLENFVGKINRTAENIQKADAQLTLSKDIIHYAQFWYIDSNEFDKIAINCLNIGDVDKAISIWEKKENLSSVHNRVITYLALRKYDCALDLAFLFYSKYSEAFVNLILGNVNQLPSSDNLSHDFLDVICDEVGMSKISKYIKNEEWKSYVSEKIVGVLFNKIDNNIAIAKGSKGKDAADRLAAGVKLRFDTFTVINKLRDELDISDPRYKISADKLAIEILQCSIDYYNNSDDEDAANKALDLEKYALSIAVGKLATERCRENIKILKKIISELPPTLIMTEYKAIKAALQIFSKQSEFIIYSIRLIKKCAPLLLSIKEKLGKDDLDYLHISTLVVRKALGNVISEVNEAQDGDDFIKLKVVLINAWTAQLYLDKFDIESEYKEKHYKKNREALYGIIESCKGFEQPRLTIKYEYGCGWCNNLDVSDIDMRTDDEIFNVCNTIDDFERYIKRAKGKHIQEAYRAIEKLHFDSCKTISDYQEFINKFPNGTLLAKAQKILNDLKVKENERFEENQRQEKAISLCKTLAAVFDLYAKERTKNINVDKCSQKAFKLARTEDDFKKIISIFGTRSFGGQKASAELREIERIRKERAVMRSKILKGVLIIGFILFIIAATYFIWNLRGLSVLCITITVISGFCLLGTLDEKSGCAIPLVCLIVAAVFGISAYQLDEMATKIEKREKSQVFYKWILKNPSTSVCADYLEKYEKTDNADNVRQLWLNLLKLESAQFDYATFDGRSKSKYIDIPSQTPIQKLQEFGKDNVNTIYKDSAELYISQICDSLYNIAVKKGTKASWLQYQNVVPTDYFKDSDERIKEIENKAWNTEPKAWRQACAENTLSAYEKYISMYPWGSHSNACEKKIIDIEVSNIYAGDHGSLPEMDKTGYGGGSTSYIYVTNSTSYTLTLLYSGADSKRLIIGPNGSSSIRLKNGTYRVAASVSASNVGKYAGNEHLTGGEYSVDYYISSYRY